ncbi:hypothetical protein BC940DRAFT_318241 [Gongronella butleri]|nr:hypothetical protein BC940DRAFT_318241 [Gongronella butleri]
MGPFAIPAELPPAELDNVHVPFQLSLAHYTALRIISYIGAACSIVMLFALVSTYTYMLMYHRQASNRVTLRCIFLANLVSIVTVFLDIVALSRSVSKGDFCLIYSIIDGVFTMLAGVLTCVTSIHLITVFYFHVNWRFRPDYLLIPFCFVYAIIGNILNFGVFRPDMDKVQIIYFYLPENCWYYCQYIDRSVVKATWIYYYAFFGFFILISFIASLVTMYGIYKERRRNYATMAMPATSASSASDETRDNISMDQYLMASMPKLDFNVKIVLRSLLYPFVPLIVNVWGFALEMTLIPDNSVANYGLIVMNTLFNSFEAVLIGCIFFSDPTSKAVSRKGVGEQGERRGGSIDKGDTRNANFAHVLLKRHIRKLPLTMGFE